ncbi:uncharacterized protein M421DRAFT_6698 [Didymella exigua CBS 183.55]|uniref:F-box domain-containing protein n=1 Tax=Didymella exigua CBS 183.55 TaxID=1150837 RepID=A0A6A5RHS0_9PLEO|nr:uncharacterized protein M421DRAFT_6698 [Didymella exigua CBS 183.55]KAF1926790.1 hypothetical protein M421DRAFT_6698 [Didymella exigua CBS 183.55]
MESTDEIASLTLPPEILGLIFSFLRDRKNMVNIRLVSATWKAVVARQMWTTIITDFRPLENQDLGALFHPKSGILPYVRRLIVCKVDGLFLRDLVTGLRRFLERIPRDSLKEFVSLSPLSPAMLKDLIAWHRDLERLEAFIDPILDEFKQCDWMLPRLSKIKTYQIWIQRTTEKQSLEVHRMLMNGMSSLEDLEIYYEPRRISQASPKLFVDISSIFATGIRLSRLNNLTLWGVDMRQSSSPLLERFEISKLRKLHLLDCSYASMFTNSLSDWYSEYGGLLDTFHFRYPCHLSVAARKVVSASLKRFIMVCPSLSYLIIEHRGNPVVPVDCIIKHGKTLRGLRVGTDAWPGSLERFEFHAPTYPARDLETILAACQYLKTLGLDMPFNAVDLGPISDPKISFELARQATNEVHVLPEFEEFLSIIGRHPNIRTLRILTLPKMRYKYRSQFHPLLMGYPDTQENANGCQRAMHRFADEVFRFLDSCKSTVQFLEAKPTLRPSLPAEWDEKGHQWPDYSYKARKTTFNGCIVSWSKPCRLHYSTKAVQNA